MIYNNIYLLLTDVAMTESTSTRERQIVVTYESTVRDSYRPTVQMLKDLFSSSSTATLQIKSASVCKWIMKAEGNIHCKVYEGDPSAAGNTPIFTGYLSDKYTWGYTTSKDKVLEVTIEDPSIKAFDKLYVSVPTYKSWISLSEALTEIINDVNSTLSTEEQITIGTVPEISVNLSKKIDVNETVSDILSDICFECRCVYYFSNGMLCAVTIADAVDTGTELNKDNLIAYNNKEVWSVEKEVVQYKNAKVWCKTLKDYTNALVYNHTEGATTGHPYCYVEVPAHTAFPSMVAITSETTDEELRLVDQCEKILEDPGAGKVILKMTNVTQAVEGTGFTPGEGHNYIDRMNDEQLWCLAKNTTDSTHYITKFQATADVTVEDETIAERTGEELDLDKVYEYECKYLHDQTSISKLANLIAQYYQNSNKVYTFYSRLDLPLATTVYTIDANPYGLSTKVLPIKKETLRDIYKYTAVGYAAFELTRTTNHTDYVPWTIGRGPAGSSGTDGKDGLGSWSAITSDGVTQQVSTFTKTTSTEAWDEQMYSREGFSEGCYVSAQPVTTNGDYVSRVANEENCLDFVSDDPFKIIIRRRSSSYTLQYKVPEGDWTNISWGSSTNCVRKSAGYSADNRYHVYLRGSENTNLTYLAIYFDSPTVDCYGNVMTLLDYENTPTTLTAQSAMYGLFVVWPAESETYAGETYGVRRSPDLPATSLSPYCYNCMFGENNTTTTYGTAHACLATAPVLPATDLTGAYGCYEHMFAACPLVEPPELPATTLTARCYYSMFYNCTSLRTMPELPAQSIPDAAYKQMFYNCSNLVINNALASETPRSYRIPTTGTGGVGTDSLLEMFYGTQGDAPDTPEVNTTYYIYGEAVDGDVAFGLSHDPTASASYLDIDACAVFNNASQELRIYESGAYIGSYGSYTSDTLVKVAYEENTFKYYKNGVLIYTSTLTPETPLYLDSSFYSQGSGLKNVTYGAMGVGEQGEPAYLWDISTSTDTYTRDLRSSESNEITLTANISGYRDTPEWTVSVGTLSSSTGSPVVWTIPENTDAETATVIMSGTSVDPATKILTGINNTEYNVCYGYISDPSVITSVILDGDYFVCSVTGSTYNRGTTYEKSGDSWVSVQALDAVRATKLLTALNILKQNDLDLGSVSNSNTVSWFSTLVAAIGVFSKLFAEEITMTESGVIKSSTFNGTSESNYDDFSQGFRLSSNDGVIRAAGATFKNVDIDGLSTLRGDVRSSAFRTTLQGGDATARAITATSDTPVWGLYDLITALKNAGVTDSAVYSNVSFTEPVTGTGYIRRGNEDVVAGTITVNASTSTTFTVPWASSITPWIVRNDGEYPVNIWMDGTNLGQIFPGSSITITTAVAGSVISGASVFWTAVTCSIISHLESEYSNTVSLIVPSQGYTWTVNANPTLNECLWTETEMARPSLTVNGTVVNPALLYKWDNSTMPTTEGTGALTDSAITFTSRDGSVAVTGVTLTSASWTGSDLLYLTDTNGVTYMLDTTTYYQNLGGSWTVPSRTNLVETTSIEPYDGASGTYNIGTSTKKYNLVYANTINGNLTGDVTGDLTGNVTGNVNSAGTTNSVFGCVFG